MLPLVRWISSKNVQWSETRPPMIRTTIAPRSLDDFEPPEVAPTRLRHRMAAIPRSVVLEPNAHGPIPIVMENQQNGLIKFMRKQNECAMHLHNYNINFNLILQKHVGVGDLRIICKNNNNKCKCGDAEFTAARLCHLSAVTCTNIHHKNSLPKSKTLF